MINSNSELYYTAPRRGKNSSKGTILHHPSPNQDLVAGSRDKELFPQLMWLRWHVANFPFGDTAATSLLSPVPVSFAPT